MSATYRAITTQYVDRLKSSRNGRKGTVLYRVYTCNPDKELIEIGAISKFGRPPKAYFVSGRKNSFSCPTISSVISCLWIEFGVIKNHSFFNQRRSLGEIIKSTWKNVYDYIWHPRSAIVYDTNEYNGVTIRSHHISTNNVYITVDEEACLGPMSMPQAILVAEVIKGDIDLYQGRHTMRSFCLQCDKRGDCKILSANPYNAHNVCRYWRWMDKDMQAKEATNLLVSPTDASKELLTKHIDYTLAHRTTPAKFSPEDFKEKDTYQLCLDLLEPSDMQ